MSAANSLLPPGVALLGRYQVVRLLGQGGFGAVYLASDLRLAGRAVAVKENFDSSPDAQAQFKIEADMLANLSHPSLPRVTDHFAEVNGHSYLVMDYIEGDDLETLVRRSGKLGEAQVLPWIDQVCDALTYLHTQPHPIIHRDVNPRNIRIRSDGRAMLVDFGIAKLYDPAQKTQLGARAVSPGYSPLEQYGRASTDARSDIYALGATTYFVLTGVPPPEATDLAARTGQLQPPRTLAPNLSPQVEQAILKAMEISADARFQTAEALHHALRTPPVEILAFCVREKAKQPMKDAALVQLANGKYAYKGICQSCGTTLMTFVSEQQAASNTVLRRCPHCGGTNRFTARFCQHCRADLQTQPSSSRAKPSAAPASANAPVKLKSKPASIPVSAITVSLARYFFTIVLIGAGFGLLQAGLRNVLNAMGLLLPLNFIVVAFAYIAAPLVYLCLQRPGAAFLTNVLRSVVYLTVLGARFELTQPTFYVSAIILESVFALTGYKRNGWGIVVAATCITYLLAPLVSTLFTGGSIERAVSSLNAMNLIGSGMGGLLAYTIKRKLG